MNYLLHILIMINIYVILTLSLNLLVGYTGLLSLCHAAFYGIGAYVTTLLMMKTGLNFSAALMASVITSALISLIISLPSLRLKGDYFVLASLGFQIIVFSILYNWIDITQGPYGIPGIPQPVIFGLKINTLTDFFFFTSIISIASGLLIWLITVSPYGRVLKAIREDEIAAASLGKNIYSFKVSAFAISAAFAAISGALFATYIRYIDPTSFTLMEAIVIIGGAGSSSGPIIGTILMIFLPEILRFLRIPDAIVHNMRQIIYGFLLIILMHYRPKGIAGEYDFE